MDRPEPASTRTSWNRGEDGEDAEGAGVGADVAGPLEHPPVTSPIATNASAGRRRAAITRCTAQRPDQAESG